MRTITPEIFKAYQALNPQDEKLQSLTLEELYKETGSGQVDWNQITYKPSPPELLGASGWDCATGIGYVVFDCVCLFLGAASLRASFTAKAAEEIAEAAKPAASQIEKYVATLADANASKTSVAGAVLVVSGLAGGVSGQQYAEPQQVSPFSTALSTALGVGGLYGKIFK